MKNDKWVICSVCKSKVRNDSVDMKNHGSGGVSAGPDPATGGDGAAVQKCTTELADVGRSR